MFPRYLQYLQYLLMDFRQTFVTGASWDTDDLITFWGQKVKVQGHTIAAEVHSTRHYHRVQLFLVVNLVIYRWLLICDLCAVRCMVARLKVDFHVPRSCVKWCTRACRTQYVLRSGCGQLVLSRRNSGRR